MVYYHFNSDSTLFSFNFAYNFAYSHFDKVTLIMVYYHINSDSTLLKMFLSFSFAYSNFDRANLNINSYSTTICELELLYKEYCK